MMSLIIKWCYSERTVALMQNPNFVDNITLGTNSLRKVEARFKAVNSMLREVFDD